MLVVESSVDKSTSSGIMRIHSFMPSKGARFPGIAVFTEIYQVTGPVQRFCRQISSHGYLVAVCESYHEFEKPGTVLKYDTEGTDLGNKYKIEKKLESYDEDSKILVDYLYNHPYCSKRIGTTGMCLGGHLAFRCAFDPRVSACVSYFATDIHSESLAFGRNSDSLIRCQEIKGELLMIFGKQDTHVPASGRLKIYNKLSEYNVNFSWIEVQAQHAFIRDELSKGRYDAHLAKNCFEMLLELFFRTLYVDYGSENNKTQNHQQLEHVC